MRRMELPKLLRPHSEKENRPIEVQLNEAKKLAMFFIVYAFAAWGTLFLLFVAKVFWGDVMASYIKGFKDIVDVLVVLMFTAYLASSIIFAFIKRTDEHIKEYNSKKK